MIFCKACWREVSMNGNMKTNAAVLINANILREGLGIASPIVIQNCCFR